jgi:hypothetical protein
MPEVLPSIEPEDAPPEASVHSDGMHSDSTYSNSISGQSPMSPCDVNEKIWDLGEGASHEDTQTPWEEGEEEEVKAITELQNTNPQEHEHRKRAYNLRKQGLSLAKLEKSSRRPPEQEIDVIWDAFLRGPEVPKSTPTNKHPDASRNTHDESSSPSRRATKQFKNNAPALASISTQRASNTAKVKVPRSKQPKAEQRKGKRESRRQAGKLIECGIFADPRKAPPVPESLRRDPSTRKRNPAGLCSQALLKKSISVEVAKPQGILKSRPVRTRRTKRTGG